MYSKLCVHCKNEKLIIEFHKDKSRKDGYSAYCLDCRRLSNLKKIEGYKLKNRSTEKDYSRNIKCSRCKIQKSADLFYNNDCTYTGFSNVCKECYAKNYIDMKTKVLNAYGGLFCMCCGEDDFYSLTLDHINNNGKQERMIFGNGIQIYKMLISKNFPSGYQVLCYNCNICKHKNGGNLPEWRKNRCIPQQN